jgi:hypothetical protein
MTQQTNEAIAAIRKIELIDCDILRGLFDVIAAKMTQADFSNVDMTMIDEAADFICGECVDLS